MNGQEQAQPLYRLIIEPSYLETIEFRLLVDALLTAAREDRARLSSRTSGDAPADADASPVEVEAA